jgi:hypothetical protein
MAPPPTAPWVPYVDQWGSLDYVKPPQSSVDRQQALTVAYQKYHPILQDFRLGGLGDHSLRQLLGFCRDHRIQTTLVIYPEGPEFRSWYARQAPEIIRQHIVALAQQYKANVVDAWHWYDEVDFGDSHHLLAAGAEKLSQRVSQEVAAQWQHTAAFLARDPTNTTPR